MSQLIILTFFVLLLFSICRVVNGCNVVTVCLHLNFHQARRNETLVMWRQIRFTSISINHSRSSNGYFLIIFGNFRFAETLECLSAYLPTSFSLSLALIMYNLFDDFEKRFHYWNYAIMRNTGEIIQIFSDLVMI